MTLEELFLKLGLDVDTAAFARGQALVESLKVGLQLAAKAVKAAFDTTTEVAEWADAVDEASQKTGIAAETLQELAHAASFSGLDLQSMTLSLGFLQKAMVASQTGSKDLKKLFKDMGVEVADSSGAFFSAQDVMEQLADRFAELPDGAEKYDAAIKLFGKSGSSMIPFLNAGADGIQKLRGEARELGLVLSEDQVKAGAAANDSLDRLKLTWTGLKRVLGAELFPVLTQVTGGISAWVKENRELIKSGLHAFVVVVTGAVHALRFAWDLMRIAVEFVIKHLKTFALVLGSIVLAAIALNIKAIIAWIAAQGAAALAAVAAAGTTALAWAAAALPVLALAAAIAGVAYILYRFRDQVWSVVSEIGGAFSDMGAGIRDLFVVIFGYLTEQFQSFIGWVERQIDRVVSAARWVKNQVAPDADTLLGQLGLGQQVAAFRGAERSIAFGRETAARASQVTSTTNITQNITAPSPEDAAKQSADLVKDAQDSTMREALAGIGGVI